MVELGAEPEGESTELADLLQEVRAALAKLQPALRARLERGQIIVEGELVVTVPGNPDEVFRVILYVSRDFPESEPKVFEVGERIPRTIERHTFSEDGSCCLGTWEEWLIRSDDHSFEAFLHGPLDGYFFSQAYYELSERVNGPGRGKWPFGERAHNALGVVQSYCDAMGIAPEPSVLAAYLKLLLRREVKGHTRCPCGSGQRLRSCHGEQFRLLQKKVSPKLAARMTSRLSNLLKSTESPDQKVR